MWTFDAVDGIDSRDYVCPNDESSVWELYGLEDRLRDEFDRQIWIDDWSYMYLGYLVTDDEDIKLFASVYRERVAKGLPFEDIPRPDAGEQKPDSLLRLRVGIERFLITDINNPGASVVALSQIPVLIEKPWHHDGFGGHVAYMDGHVEYVEFPNWPMTTRTMELLRELDSMGATAP